MSASDKARLFYAFGHLVASHNPEDPHHADSGDLADETLIDLGFSVRERSLIEDLAEHVAGNYEWTGKAQDYERRVERGEA